MSATQTDALTLAAADRWVARLFELFGDCCERLEVAGSVRRRCPVVHDLDLVAIPKRDGLFDDDAGPSLLTRRCDELCDAGKLQYVKGADRYRQYVIAPGARPFTLELWITTPERWGVIMAIRTGAEDFAHRLVKPRTFGGLLPNDLTIAEGRVWRDRIIAHVDGRNLHKWIVLAPGTPLDTPEEQDVLELAGGWVAPEARR